MWGYFYDAWVAIARQSLQKPNADEMLQKAPKAQGASEWQVYFAQGGEVCHETHTALGFVDACIFWSAFIAHFSHEYFLCCRRKETSSHGRQGMGASFAVRSVASLFIDLLVV